MPTLMDHSTNTLGPSILPNDPRLARCGFAKLQGEGLEFFVRKYEVTIGRTSKNSNLDLILGDSTTISRQHATIRYNFESKCFELVVLGKNGVTVESSGNGATHLYTPDSPPTPLRSRDLLIMGEKRFYFLLPRAMGGQSRKRRRLEPSPGPGLLTHPVGPAGAVPTPSQDQHPGQRPPSSANQLTNLHDDQQCHKAAPLAAPVSTAIGPTGSVPTSGQTHLPSHPSQGVMQVPHPQASQTQAPHPHAHGTSIGHGTGLGALQQQPYQVQQDDDTLINASALPYDNGVPYGYGDGNNGFSATF